MVSFERNVIASYASQIYVTAIGILMVPVYLYYMGAEAYGLVAFFTMMQAWFQLLDAGMTPTMARETARFRGKPNDPMQLRRLFCSMEGVFIGMALAWTVIIAASSGSISGGWLQAQQLSLSEVQGAVMLIGAIIALRWVCGLYRSIVAGFEQLVWLGSFNVLIATARFALVIPIFILVGAGPIEFFLYQLAIALTETFIVVRKARQLLPAIDSAQKPGWQFAPLGAVLKFSLSIAVTAGVWVVMVQTDKLVLSRSQPLGEFASFTLAVLAASGVSILASPLGSALLPRLTRLHSEQDEAAFVRSYRNATQLVAVISIPVTLVMTLFPAEVLWAWTGNEDIARTAASTLRLYAMGNGILAVSAFAYYVQFAKGDMRMHLFGAALFMVFLLPLLVWITWRYGATGAGLSWAGANAAYFLFWVPMVHRRFLKGLHARWLVHDVGIIALSACMAAVLLHSVMVLPAARLPLIAELILVGAVLVAAAGAASSFVRQTVSGTWRMRFTS